MTSALFELSDAEKLETLRKLDQFREWCSLDESRYCLVCGNLFTGREIRVTADDGDSLARQVKCPTEHCNSIAIDWVLPTDKILAAIRQNGIEDLPPAAL